MIRRSLEVGGKAKKLTKNLNKEVNMKTPNQVIPSTTPNQKSVEIKRSSKRVSSVKPLKSMGKLKSFRPKNVVTKEN